MSLFFSNKKWVRKKCKLIELLTYSKEFAQYDATDALYLNIFIGFKKLRAFRKCYQFYRICESFWPVWQRNGWVGASHRRSSKRPERRTTQGSNVGGATGAGTFYHVTINFFESKLVGFIYHVFRIILESFSAGASMYALVHNTRTFLSHMKMFISKSSR